MRTPAGTGDILWLERECFESVPDVVVGLNAGLVLSVELVFVLVLVLVLVLVELLTLGGPLALGVALGPGVVLGLGGGAVLALSVVAELGVVLAAPDVTAAIFGAVPAKPGAMATVPGVAVVAPGIAVLGTVPASAELARGATAPTQRPSAKSTTSNVAAADFVVTPGTRLTSLPPCRCELVDSAMADRPSMRFGKPQVQDPVPLVGSTTGYAATRPVELTYPEGA